MFAIDTFFRIKIIISFFLLIFAFVSNKHIYGSILFGCSVGIFVGMLLTIILTIIFIDENDDAIESKHKIFAVCITKLFLSLILAISIICLIFTKITSVKIMMSYVILGIIFSLICDMLANIIYSKKYVEGIFY